MSRLKKGDVVKPNDGSYVMELTIEDQLKQVFDGRTIIRRKFEVVAVDCDLPSDNDDERNNTILRAIDNNQVIFIMADQLNLVHRCQSCPSCGQQL